MTNRDKRPYVPPVKKITLSESNPKLRVIAIVVCLLIAGAALAIGLTGLLNRDSGWQVVESTSSQRNLSGEFILRYDFSRSGANAPADRRTLSQLYTEVMEHAYAVFSTAEVGSGGLADINASPNEAVAVDPVLYDALETVRRSGSRYLYLAPAYVEYNRVFRAETPEIAAQYDPSRDAELAGYLRQIASFASNPAHVNVELLGENRVCLQVSEDYLAFAETNEIDGFLDFGWTKNAFVTDYVAEQMLQKGYTAGYITSYDGFTRNLDDAGSYSINVFSRLDNAVNLPAVLEYTGPVSLVVLKDYGMTEQDSRRYRALPDGSVVTAMLDPADGRSKSAVHDLLCCSKELSCAELLLQAAPYYVADMWDSNALQTLEEKGIHAVWSEDTVLHRTDAELRLLPNQDCAVPYTIAP